MSEGADFDAKGPPSGTRKGAPKPFPGGTSVRSPRRPMNRFLIVLGVVTAVVHIPFGVAVRSFAARTGLPSPGAFGFLAAATLMATFLSRARASMPDRKRHGTLHLALDIPYFIHWCACMFMVVPSFVAAFGFALGDAFGVTASHDHGQVYEALYAAGLVVCGYGVLVRRRVFRIETYDVEVQGLPPAFDGYRIAHLSDLHIGALTPRSWGERWVRAANDLQPDLAVVTGDMVTSGTEFHEDIAIVLGGLKARDGAIVSMGNHDYFGEGEPLIRLLREAGLSVLRNEGKEIRREDAGLFVAGVDDTWTRRADMGKALEGRPQGAVAVLLAHDPGLFPEAAARNVELVLSGHTHGGQIALPYFPRQVSLSYLAHQYHLGLYRLGASQLYVHPGLGTTGPPIRLGVAPAVALLRLRSATSDAIQERRS